MFLGIFYRLFNMLPWPDPGLFPMCILKLINEFHAPIVDALKTEEQPLGPAVESELWREFANKIQASRDGQQGA